MLSIFCHNYYKGTQKITFPGEFLDMMGLSREVPLQQDRKVASSLPRTTSGTRPQGRQMDSLQDDRHDVLARRLEWCLRLAGRTIVSTFVLLIHLLSLTHQMAIVWRYLHVWTTNSILSFFWRVRETWRQLPSNGHLVESGEYFSLEVIVMSSWDTCFSPINKIPLRSRWRTWRIKLLNENTLTSNLPFHQLTKHWKGSSRELNVWVGGMEVGLETVLRHERKYMNLLAVANTIRPRGRWLLEDSWSHFLSVSNNYSRWKDRRMLCLEGWT